MARRALPAVIAALTLALVAGCKKKDDAATGPAPAAATAPTPSMPKGWKVVSDLVVAPAEARTLAKRLGGEVSAIRNTLFEVDGKQVKVNTLVAPDEGAAAKLLAGLRKLKDQQFMLQKGTTVYEFVCNNDAIPLVAAGRQHLEGK